MSFPISYAHTLLWLGNIGLLVVFAWAGIAKLRDTQRASEGLTGFGVPERWAQPMAIALALMELFIAALLVYPPTQLMGAWGALTLLAIFTLALVWQLAQGHRPNCACFGALTQSAISWKSVTRNLVLMTLAAGLIAFPTPLVFAEIPPPALIALAWAMLSTLWLLNLTRQNGRLLLRIEQLERPRDAEASPSTLPLQPLQVGDVVPPLHLNDVRGRPFDLRNFRGKPVLFLFLDVACTHCRTLLTQLREVQLAQAQAALVVISENDELRHELPVEVTLLVDPAWSTPTLFGARGTPAATFVDADGALTQLAVHGTSAVRAALDQVLAQDAAHGAAQEEAHYELAPV